MTGAPAPSLIPCPGCGAVLSAEVGPTHAYMLSSPACWRLYGEILAAEYSAPHLMPIHRLSVDAYAVQHPGDSADRRAVQSVWIHLARLMLQVDEDLPPAQLNARMQDFVARKDMGGALPPPASFSVTIADVAPFAGSAQHGTKVREWAHAVWRDWTDAHERIRKWVHRP